MTQFSIWGNRWMVTNPHLKSNLNLELWDFRGRRAHFWLESLMESCPWKQGSGKLRLKTGQIGWRWHSEIRMRTTWNGKGQVMFREWRISHMCGVKGACGAGVGWSWSVKKQHGNEGQRSQAEKWKIEANGAFVKGVFSVTWFCWMV